MALEGRIVVTPEVLESKAREVREYIRVTESTFQDIENKVARTTAYWNGEAADHHRKLFNDEKAEIENILKRLKEHPKDLEIMAGVYKEAEAEVTKTNERIPNNLIS